MASSTAGASGRDGTDGGGRTHGGNRGRPRNGTGGSGGAGDTGGPGGGAGADRAHSTERAHGKDRAPASRTPAPPRRPREGRRPQTPYGSGQDPYENRPVLEGGGARDIAGVLLLGCCAAWALITSAGRDARPEGLLLAVLALGAGYACGRVAGSLLPAGAPAVVALSGLFLALRAPSPLPGAADPSGPLAGAALASSAMGRTGATAALLTLSAGAACCAAWAAPTRTARVGLWLVGAGLVGVSAVMGSAVGVAATLAVLLCSLVAARVGRRTGLAAMALAALAVAVLTWAVAAGAFSGPLGHALGHQLTPHKVSLWREALGTARRHLLLGSGPGTADGPGVLSYGTEQTGTRPHSAPLQLSAEQGLPGLALLAAVYGWLLLALNASSRSTPVVLSAGVALTGLAALACTGNALSFTQVTAGAALLAGIACARRLS